MTLKRKSEKDENSKNKTLDDIKYVTLGTGSGAIVGGGLAKIMNNAINQVDLEDHLLHNSEGEQAKYLLSLKNSSSGKARKRYKQIIDEAAEMANPKVKRARIKKGRLIGAGAGLLISGAGLAAKKLREKKDKKKEKSFSDEKLPNDWNETDNKYVKLVEKGIKKNEKFSNLDKFMKQSYTKGGALVGAYLGFRRGKLHRPPKTKGGTLLLGKRGNLFKEHPEILRTVKGTAEGALGGLGFAILSSQVLDIGGASDKIKKLGERERAEARRIIKKYKKMETSEERKGFRKKIGVKF